MSAQIPAVERGSEQICLGLQTKASLGAGLHWTSKSCTSIGGYICKRRASVDHDTIVQNQTISDSYGRLTSPGNAIYLINRVIFYLNVFNRLS